jgi:hypothetical protein
MDITRRDAPPKVPRPRLEDVMLGKVRHMILTPESRDMIDRFSAAGFYRFGPLQMVVRREAFRTELGHRKLKC